MKLFEPVTEDHMVAAFVRAEIDSPDFGFLYRLELKRRGLARAIVDKPDLEDSNANQVRKQLLAGGGRGYPTKALFQGWPNDVHWWKAEVGRDELGTVKFIHDAPWLRLSDGTRLVRDGVANVGVIPQLDGLSAKIRAVEGRVREGYAFPELVLVATSESDPIVVLEGNTRAAAYVLAGRAAPDPIAALAGFSAYLVNWPFLGSP